jgi:hypothetical protein
MRRWELIRLFSNMVVAWPLTARAQQMAMLLIGSPREARNDYLFDVRDEEQAHAKPPTRRSGVQINPS